MAESDGAAPTRMAGDRPPLGRSIAGLASDPGVRRALVIVLGLRLAFGLVAWVSLAAAPAAVLPGRPLPAPGAGPVFDALVNPWQRWDSWHYQAVAAGGYPRGSLEVAFFPAFPLLERIVAVATGGSVAVAGLLVSTVAAVAGLALVHRLVSADFGDEMAGRTLLYLGLAPTAMFLVAPYTEALYLAVSAAAFLALRQRRFVAAAGFIGVAALTRPQGLLLLVPAAAVILPLLRGGGLAGSVAKIRPGHLGLFAIPLAAFGLWMAATAAWVGMTPLSAEDVGWGSHLTTPWRGLIDGLGSTAAYPGPIYNAVTVGIWVALLVVLISRRSQVPIAYTAYAAVSLLPIIVREEGFGNPWASAPRFALVVFPLFLALALVTRGRRLFHAALITVSGLLAVSAVVVFVHNQFVA